MKKIVHFFTMSTALTLVLSSCNKRLDDIAPINTALATDALKTSADVQSLLAGGYAVIGSPELYGGRLQYSADLLGDPLGPNSELFWQGTFTQPSEIYRKRILVNNSFVAGTWTQAYRAINIANTVLANLGKVATVQQAQVEGGAKFIRGTMYFELARLYARAWNDGDPATNPGVPIILTSTDVQTPDAVIGTPSQVARNSVAEVYAQAIKDLTEAETKLKASAPASATATFYATTYTASGMLSRVYLQQGQYSLAATEADKVISSGIYRLTTPISDEFNSKINTSEDIFANQITVQAGTNDLNTFYSTNGRGGDIAVQDALYNLYNKADDRAQLFNFDNGTLTTKFDQVFGNIHVMRLAEMYLTRAEGNFRAGTRVGATPVSDINLVRGRAKLPALVSVTLASILLERHLELAFEGFYLHDLKRNALPVGSLPYNSPRLIFPIPQREIDVNPNLAQNAGY
jgi:hypothetical protein